MRYKILAEFSLKRNRLDTQSAVAYIRYIISQVDNKFIILMENKNIIVIKNHDNIIKPVISRYIIDINNDDTRTGIPEKR